MARNYGWLASHPVRIVELFATLQARQLAGRDLRRASRLLQRALTNAPAARDDAPDDPELAAALDGARTRDEVLQRARGVKAQLALIEEAEVALEGEMEELALALPNLTSEQTPRPAAEGSPDPGPRVLRYLNMNTDADTKEPKPDSSDRVWRSHIHIGSELGLLDFAGAARSSGWGFYNLVGDAVLLEQALVQCALGLARSRGFLPVAPPSMVYSHAAAACGFQPRDKGGEEQIYRIVSSKPPDQDGERRGEEVREGKPELCMAGTAEIPLAAMQASQTLDGTCLPLRAVGMSRCFRAEAGARGAGTKGLYRVHEFTKVELFGWTAPTLEAATVLFDELVELQTTLLGALGLQCRVLEMPASDLGASAFRKIDIEAYFPSRRDTLGSGGWGEVTSASICTDYQTRRLATRARVVDGSQQQLVYPYTINGTALAVPRVLACLLEMNWHEERRSVRIPKILRPWMDGREEIVARPGIGAFI